MIAADDLLLVRSVTLHEGYRGHVYRDSVGCWTLGIGRLVEPPGGISREESEVLLANDLQRCLHSAHVVCPTFGSLPDDAQRVLVEMIFQLGARGVAGFGDMLGALAALDYTAAAAHGLDSVWATQTPARAREMMARLAACQEA